MTPEPKQIWREKSTGSIYTVSDIARLMARIARLEKTNAHLKQCYKDKTGESIPFNFAELCDSE